MLCTSTCLNATNHGMSASTMIVLKINAACHRGFLIHEEGRIVIASTFCHAVIASIRALANVDIIRAALQFGFRRYLVDFRHLVYHLVLSRARPAAKRTFWPSWKLNINELATEHRLP